MDGKWITVSLVSPIFTIQLAFEWVICSSSTDLSVNFFDIPFAQNRGVFMFSVVQSKVALFPFHCTLNESFHILMLFCG